MATGTLCRLPARVPDPLCSGRPLSEWLLLIGQSNGVAASATQKREAVAAVQQIGTNALPALLTWVAYEYPLERYHLVRLFNRLPIAIALNRSVQRLLLSPPMDEQAQNAVEAFAALGPAAAPAFQELVRRASVPLSQAASSKRNRAMAALIKIGPPAVPLLAAQLAAPRGPGDLFLLCAIRDLGPNAYSLIPLLVKNLQHPNAFAASMNARTLGELKLDPGLVVPALTRCLQDPRADLRGEAARALAEFGSRARLALPALTNALADSESEVRVKAGLATQRNAPDDHTNASTL